MKFIDSEIRSFDKLYDAFKVKDYEEPTIKMLSSLIAQYNKTKEELNKLEKIDYAKLRSGLKNPYDKNGWSLNKGAENLEQSRYRIRAKLEQKLEDLNNQFNNIKHNSRNSIQNFLGKKDLNGWFGSSYGTDENEVAAKLQKEYDNFSKTIKIAKMGNLSNKVKQIVGRMEGYSSYDWAGKVDYIEAKDVYRITLNFDYDNKQKGKEIRAKQVLKAVQQYYPNAYIEKSIISYFIYIPASDVEL